ncbi:MAG: cation:proton antiporter subunit C [Planctomycetes bacterium]|nr:cation:proton antiporter subunit C [Planctomycetota bacterium]MCL4729926.1 cation:proton antiporter subunit C [Planctomycetota bacterium]
MRLVLDYYNYWVCIILMMVGFYGVMAKTNLVKKAIALGLFQTGILVFYITIGKVEGGTGPVTISGAPADAVYSNPLPHALMLTAIVVGVSTLAVAMALAVKIREKYGTIDDHDIHRLEHEMPD